MLPILLRREMLTRLNRVGTVTTVLVWLLIVIVLGQATGEGSRFAGLLWILLVLAPLLYGPAQRWRMRYQQQRAIQQRWDAVNAALGARSSIDVLAAAPFTYARWPDGDNAFLISDKRSGDILHQEQSADACQLWILEQQEAHASQSSMQS